MTGGVQTGTAVEGEGARAEWIRGCTERYTAETTEQNRVGLYTQSKPQNKNRVGCRVVHTI